MYFLTIFVFHNDSLSTEYKLTCNYLIFHRIGSYSNISSIYSFNLNHIAHRISYRNLIEISCYLRVKKETHSRSRQLSLIEIMQIYLYLISSHHRFYYSHRRCSGLQNWWILHFLKLIDCFWSALLLLF